MDIVENLLLPFKKAVDLVQKDSGNLFDVVDAVDLCISGTQNIMTQWPGERAYLLQCHLDYRRGMLNDSNLLILVKVLRPHARLNNAEYAEPIPAQALRQLANFIEPRYRSLVDKGQHDICSSFLF